MEIRSWFAQNALNVRLKEFFWTGLEFVFWTSLVGCQCWLFPGHRLWRGKPIQLLLVRIFDPLLCVSSSGFLSIKWRIKIKHFINIQLKIGRTAKNILLGVYFVMRHVPFSGRRHTQFLCTWEKWINSWFPTFHLVGYVERFPSHSLLFYRFHSL